ncbi:MULTISPECIES: TerB family tellurite resistance protein [Spongiibacter]|uniref:tellurite resistance TerB family protein n=1 Tax=Spongiibacter TaxID=630749 RepID=UPI000C65E7EE|nr:MULTISPECIES: TerB family tellurite resistance protein [Spongiibacter]MAY40260.1 hypothetical protein [Spongiibacter sp.]MBI57872.1 hypothetical protein [Spongiibacter sp.]|tara:strand:+ start:537 stop:1001 length:465 start_codon:yes stop_codon:yes gene_type:complete
MFEFLKNLLSDDDPSKQDDNMSLQLAAASLLLEVSKSDYQQDDAELEKIRELMVNHFHLESGEIEAFMARAQEQGKDTTSLYPFTRYINDNCSNDEKFSLVKALWEVAAEDGRIDKYEEHVIRKIAELIYLPHREFIRAKLMVCDAMNISENNQ